MTENPPQKPPRDSKSTGERLAKDIERAAHEIKEAAVAAEHAAEEIEQAAEDVEQALIALEPKLERVEAAAEAAAKRAGAEGLEELSRFGHLVLRAWKFAERAASPPPTVRKVLGWVAVGLLIATLWAVGYLVQYGVISVPIIEVAGSQFIGLLASLGPLGLFGFMSVFTLFFMFVPTEPFFFIVLAGSTSAVLVIAAAAFGSSIGSCVNYGLGVRLRRSAGKKTGDQRKLGKWGQRAHSKWGTVLLAFAAMVPLPELVAVAYGMADYPFKKFAVVTLGARFIKWTWIAALFLVLKATL